MITWRTIAIATGALLLALNSLYAPRVRVGDSSPLSRALLISPTFAKHGFQQTSSNTSLYEPARVDFQLWSVWSTAIIAITVAGATLAPRGGPAHHPPQERTAAAA